MAAGAGDRQPIPSSAPSWRATPHNYSSLRYLCFKSDGSGRLIYGFGQTIYAVIPCRWELIATGRLELTYSPASEGRLAESFVLDDDNRVKVMEYAITKGRVTGVENISRTPYEFDLTLELSESPWPTGLELPYEVPKVFYGRIPHANGDDI